MRDRVPLRHVEKLFYGHRLEFLCVKGDYIHFRVYHVSSATLFLDRLSTSRTPTDTFSGFLEGDRAYALDPEDVCFFDLGHPWLRHGQLGHYRKPAKTATPPKPEPFDPGSCPIELLDERQRSMFWPSWVKTTKIDADGSMHTVERQVWIHKPDWVMEEDDIPCQTPGELTTLADQAQQVSRAMMIQGLRVDEEMLHKARIDEKLMIVRARYFCPNSVTED